MNIFKKTKQVNRIQTLQLEIEDDNLCNYCPLEDEFKGVRSHPSGYTACEGSHCGDACDNAYEELECDDLRGLNLDEEVGKIKNTIYYKSESFILKFIDKVLGK